MTVPSGSDPISQTHRFICTGCHIHFTSVRTCPVCDSPVVPIAELTRVADTSMRPPQPRRHLAALVSAAIGAVAAVGLAVGETTIWGVAPSAALTAGLLVAPIARWDRTEPGDQLGDMARQAPFDGHALQEGSARAAAAVTSSRRPAAGAGMLFGVIAPWITVQPEQVQTVVAAGLATTAFLLAWIRRVRREGEASAGHGVPL